MTNIGTGSVNPGAAMREGMVPQSEAVQLSKLSSVLNGLEGGAVIIRRHVLDAMRAVRSGTYQVDAVTLSRRIVGEALGSN
ncbi:MAG: hypothetical protein JOZ62_00890 [Acidobacteriaceae bacterium]|nr:hypothetical protein [Acidobacteriaceae bacterium]